MPNPQAGERPNSNPPPAGEGAASYTHLTLPTIRPGSTTVEPGALKKKFKNRRRSV